MTPNEHYLAYVAGADLHDRRRFDAFLLGWLIQAADEHTLTAALEAAAADVNGAA